MGHTKAQFTPPPPPAKKKKSYKTVHRAQVDIYPNTPGVIATTGRRPEPLHIPGQTDPFQNVSLPGLRRGWMGQPQGFDAGATPRFIATEKGGFEAVMGLRGGGTWKRV